MSIQSKSNESTYQLAVGSNHDHNLLLLILKKHSTIEYYNTLQFLLFLRFLNKQLKVEAKHITFQNKAYIQISKMTDQIRQAVNKIQKHLKILEYIQLVFRSVGIFHNMQEYSWYLGMFLQH